MRWQRTSGHGRRAVNFRRPSRQSGILQSLALLVIRAGDEFIPTPWKGSTENRRNRDCENACSSQRKCLCDKSHLNGAVLAATCSKDCIEQEWFQLSSLGTRRLTDIIVHWHARRYDAAVTPPEAWIFAAAAQHPASAWSGWKEHRRSMLKASATLCVAGLLPHAVLCSELRSSRHRRYPEFQVARSQDHGKLFPLEG